jgi:hypothetical protein
MKKIGLISLAIVLALGTLGVGYALWSQQLTITGETHTGSLSVGFTSISPVEKYEDPVGSGIFYDGEVEGKDVGKFTSGMTDLYTDPITGKQAYLNGWVAIKNAYPCYWLHITFVIKNTGTIPVIYDQIVIDDPTGVLTWVDGAGGEDLGALVNAKGEKILQFRFVNLIGHQQHPCSTTKAEIDVHVEQPAEQGAKYEFRMKVRAIQWNEYPII